MAVLVAAWFEVGATASGSDVGCAGAFAVYVVVAAVTIGSVLAAVFVPVSTLVAVVLAVAIAPAVVIALVAAVIPASTFASWTTIGFVDGGEKLGL